jgi:hypothetical protein
MYFCYIVICHEKAYRIEFLVAVIKKSTIFWDITPLLAVPAPYTIWCCQENLQTCFCLLRERIHHTRRELNVVYRELLELHLRLAGDQFTDDWNLILPRPGSHASLRTVNKARHCKKFQRLQKAQQPPLPSGNRKTVVNLSEVPLKEAACWPWG